MEILETIIYRIIFIIISKVTGVTVLVSERGSVPAPTRDGDFWRPGFIRFYSVLTVLDDFKIFSGIWEFLK